MATITLPSSPGFKSVRAIRRKSSFMSISPYNYTQQVYSWGGKVKVVEFELPPMKSTDAENWVQFFDDLDGHVNTFQVDLSDIYKGETGLESVNMRLVDSETSFTVDLANISSFSFTAIEAK